MRHERQDRPHGHHDIRTFRDQFLDHTDDHRNQSEKLGGRHEVDEDADSELRFQARHRAPYETYSPYTDEDYGSNAKVNNSDYYRNDWDERSSRPQVSMESYRYDQSSDGTMGGSISFGRRTGGPIDLSGESTPVAEDTGRFSGVGPKGYVRSDERIHEEVCEMLTRNSSIDASGIECVVKEGEVTLSGVVSERRMKYLAEDVAAHCHGIKDIHNRLKISNANTVTEKTKKNPSLDAQKSSDSGDTH